MVAFHKDLSDVTITFDDGEVKTYRITASPSIGGYLAREAGSSGILSLFNKDQSWGIPLARIRDWSIQPVPVEVAEGEANG
jgi:hypothetical protein